MFTLLEGNRNHYIALNLARHLFLSILLLVAETDGRKPSFGDQSKVSFVIYRNPLFCSSHRQTDMNLDSMIGLARHLSVSVVLRIVRL